MLGHLIKKDILEHLMSLRFAIACVLCLIVILASLLVRCGDYGWALKDYHAESDMLKHRLDNLDGPWDLRWGEMTVYRRPNPLKIFVRGVQESYGAGMRVPSTDPTRPIVRDVQNTAVPLFPSVDLVMFVGLIMSLMALVFGYDAVCGEKQSGTLRLMLSYSVPRHLILLSKWVGGYVTLVVPFLLTVIAGTVIVLIQPNIGLNANQWLRLAAIVCFALLYIAAVYSLAVCVSCLTSRSATSVMVLVSIWVVLILVLPNLAPYAAQILKPTTSALEIEKSRNAMVKEVGERMVQEQMVKYDRQHGIELTREWWRNINWEDWESRKHLEERSVYRRTLERKASETILNEQAKLDQKFGRELDEQIELCRWMGRVSPFSCFALVAAELADEGIMDKTRYVGQLGTYQEELNGYMYDEWHELDSYELEHQGESKGPWKENRLSPIPKFVYSPPATGEYAERIGIDVGVVAGMAVVFFMLSYVRFLRYDVR